MKLKHLGVIADGNRRWAKAHGLPKLEGHRRGLKAIEKIVKAAAGAGIPFLSFYVFSTENWGREKAEVDNIMELAEIKLPSYAEKLAKNNIRMLILGSRERVRPSLAAAIEKAEKITEDCTGTTVCFCFNYGGEQEITDAANAIVQEGGEITAETIRQHLYHPEVPDVDMIVRTSGEERVSGFMLWRGAYAELLFLKKYFPEMTEADVPEIIEIYHKRQRRFGK